MQLDQFDFPLPPELIAQRPARPRDSARMLEVRGNALADLTIRDLPGCLRPGDRLIFNDTRVIPARLRGRKGEGKFEVLLHKRDSAAVWRVFARPAKRLRPGNSITFDGGLTAEVLAAGEGGERTLRFDADEATLMAALEASGEMPLPPYIHRDQGADAQDRGDYQTLFADRPGAVAAPTAALHFTPELMAALATRGVDHSFVTLHVGAGTFLPVKVENIDEHRMHAEWGEVSAATAEAVNATHAAGGRVIPVGTTSLRLLESAARDDGRLAAFTGDTDIFIRPGFPFRIADLLMTNFHLPKSTLFMLVSAFSGLKRMQAAYGHAIARNYRFFSYGDACLLHRASSDGSS